MIKETTQQEVAQNMRAQLCAGVYREIDYFVYDLTSTICNQINHAVKISNRQKQIMLSRSQIDKNKLAVKISNWQE
jgi:hypothetical protein